MIGQYVTIEAVKNLEKEYLIKDKAGISLGRFFVLELNKNNRFSMLKVALYKEEITSAFKEAITIMLQWLFIKNKMLKVTFLIEEDQDLEVFVDLNFDLEGVITNSPDEEDYKSLFLFGIDKNQYCKRGITNSLVLKNDDIVLKLLTPEYSNAMLDYYIRNKKHLKPFEPMRDEYFYTIGAQRKLLIDGYNQYMNGAAIGFGIFKDDKLIGKLQCSNIVQGVFKNGIVGYSIDGEYQDRGYMKQAIKLFAELAFSDLELHRLEATTLLDNIKSQRVLLACGFEEVGISKKYLYIDGKWRDHKIFALIKEE